SPCQNTSIDGILCWNYYGGVGNPSNKDFFHKEPTWEKNLKGEKDNYNEKIKNWEGVKIKITSEEIFTSIFLKTPGCVPIDIMVSYKKLHPHSEKNSLDYYLKIYGLGNKIDMPIKDMWKHYKQSKKSTTAESTKNMYKIAKYCIVDSLSCQKLMIRRNVVNDYREVTSIAYVSLFDSHYYAGGMKVYNLLGAEVWKRDILITMIASKQTESGKFPGAYVFPPEKGLENKYPVTGLGFASLYPSIIMNYNLSPDKMILLSEEVKILNANEKSLHKIEFPFNNLILRAWTIRHENRNENKGLYPSVLEKLLNKRNEMKKQLAKLAEKKRSHGG
ncbi:8900_t:CDS:1, partial [Entrophospora sp. SA101]